MQVSRSLSESATHNKCSRCKGGNGELDFKSLVVMRHMPVVIAIEMLHACVFVCAGKCC